MGALHHRLQSAASIGDPTVALRARVLDQPLSGSVAQWLSGERCRQGHLPHYPTGGCEENLLARAGFNWSTVLHLVPRQPCCGSGGGSWAEGFTALPCPFNTIGEVVEPDPTACALAATVASVQGKSWARSSSATLDPTTLLTGPRTQGPSEKAHLQRTFSGWPTTGLSRRPNCLCKGVLVQSRSKGKARKP